MSRLRGLTLTVAVLLSASSQTAYAGAGYPAPGSSAVNGCAGARADWARASVKNIERQGQLSARERPVLDQIKRIAALAKEPHVPLDKQLSVSEMDSFNQARAQLLYLLDAQLMSSENARDMKFAFNICLAAQRMAVRRAEFLATGGPASPKYSTWMAQKVSKEPKNLVPYDVIMLTIADKMTTSFERQMTRVARFEKGLK